ncbi:MULTISPECIES: hypothetical protein [Metallosphaera]|uniref:Uncharacterized protein n=1 Tax=Metallosphaera sedula TaxID=43687 RepID=A0A0K1SXG3_9CREN|nr:hypothetical protein [Metallosphaera sedula]AKV79296.1 hypothetical protein MsedC_1889 [Metallosphaera sedula]AKV81541.1 hypothetical protein MsedD_1890 [Metallosphaera sedula]MCH1770883.1 hypothetical protein [Metallosphaera sedula]MCP6729086.1 hypothetical protein [Metallosphaera sedula]
MYFLLHKGTVVSPVNSNESLHLSLCNRLVRLKRTAKEANRSLEIMKYSVKLVLWKCSLNPGIYNFMTRLWIHSGW